MKSTITTSDSETIIDFYNKFADTQKMLIKPGEISLEVSVNDNPVLKPNPSLSDILGVYREHKKLKLTLNYNLANYEHI